MRTLKLRNIGIVAHVDAGKTTLTERILFVAGKSHKFGDVHTGDTVTDSSVQEKQKGITIGSAAVSIEWEGKAITVIDTPGHIDFNIEVNRSLRVLDGAVVVFDSVAGVEPQSETNWRLADKYEVPRIAVINKMDRVGADYFSVIESIEDKLSAKPLVLQVPIGAEDKFVGLIDLVSMKAYQWSDEDIEYVKDEIPEDYFAEAKIWRARLLDTLADTNEALFNVILDAKKPSVELLRSVIREACIHQSYVPVCCASAYKNKGVQQVLDAIVDYLPSPADRPLIEAKSCDAAEDVEILCEEAEPFSALAFKVVKDKHGGLTYLRVYSGHLKSGDKVFNSTKGKFERIGRIYQMYAAQKQAVPHLGVGDIVAVQGLKHTDTGDTLQNFADPLLLESIVAPKPVIDVAVEAKTKADRVKMSEALNAIASEDPSLYLASNDNGQMIVSGMGELHLEIVLSRLSTDFGVEANAGKPQVAYRECLAGSASVRYLHRKQSGGPGQYAEVDICLEPLEGEQIVFVNQITGGVIPREFIPSVEKGIRAQAASGVLAGYPCGGFKVTLQDGSYHANDSSAVAFEIAAREAFKLAAKQAGVRLMEPLMALEIVTPLDYVGDCIGDINQRRGSVNEQTYRGNSVVIHAGVPLAKMFGYISDLRAISAGRASYSMSFERYSIVPKQVESLVLKGEN